VVMTMVMSMFMLAMGTGNARRPAAANRAHHSTSNSLMRRSSPAVICT
jgi:hypothetical protein